MIASPTISLPAPHYAARQIGETVCLLFDGLRFISLSAYYEKFWASYFRRFWALDAALISPAMMAIYLR